jgi:hypothetical protein
MAKVERRERRRFIPKVARSLPLILDEATKASATFIE